MPDECLRQLYEYLTEEAWRAFDTLGPLETATMERIMLADQLTTQQTRKAVWGLASTGLLIYQPVCRFGCRKMAHDWSSCWPNGLLKSRTRRNG